MIQRNYLHVRSDLSHSSLQWAIESFHKRAIGFELEVNPCQADLAARLAQEFPSIIQQVTINPTLEPAEWYVTARVSWGSPGMREVNINADVR